MLSLYSLSHVLLIRLSSCFLFFFNDTATTEIYTLSLHERSSDLRFKQEHASRLKLFAHHHEVRDRVGKVTDRKSTRLNSSHSQISYAVFCLKKKKKKKKQIT